MKSPLIARGLIALLALTTMGSGTLYIIEHHQGNQKTKDVATIQSTILANQVTLVRLRKEMGDSPNVDSTFHTMPDSPQQSDLLRELQGAAGSASVLIQSTAFGPLGTDKGQSGSQSASAVVTTLQAAGNRPALLNFVHLLQTNARPVQVQSVQLNSAADAGQEQMVLQLSFPFQGKG